jgi:similar to stage IV sporulation protein
VLDRQTPCDIVATKDGLITGIVTGAGKPLVKVNDVVKAGQVLVSGKLEMVSDVGGSGYSYVHSYAEVRAKRYTPVRFTVPYRYAEKVFTGSTEKKSWVQFLFAEGYRLNLPGDDISFRNYDKITRRNQWGVSNNYPLPVIFVTEEYREYYEEERVRTPEEAKALAEQMLTAYILRAFDFETDIVEKIIEYDETSQEVLIVNATVITNERIDKTVPIP